MIITTKPEEVLDQHARLAERLVKPSDDVADFFRYFMQDAIGKEAERAVGMFHPIMRRQDRTVTAGQGRDLARQLGHGIQYATTYEVTKEMTDAMRGVYTESMRRIEHIDEAELPCDQGFAWLDDAWDIIDTWGDTVTIRALSWDRCEVLTNGMADDPLPRPTIMPAFRLALWSHTDDDVASGRDTPEHADYVARTIGQLTMTHTAIIPFGVRFTIPADGKDAGYPGNPASADSVVAVVHLLWMFLQLEITATRQPPVERPFRRRALRTLKHNEVNVIVLRRLRYDDEDEPGRRDVEWSCRWVVQGHWRHREEPADRHRAVAASGRCVKCGRELTYIRPYLKGPPGLPLKVSRSLYKLTR